MRVAVIGSRTIPDNAAALIKEHLPALTTEIVRGGAVGIDTVAKAIAKELGIPCNEFLPDYTRFGKQAPLVRNDEIIDYADMVLAFWDGESKGTKYVIGECIKKNKRIVYIPLKGD